MFEANIYNTYTFSHIILPIRILNAVLPISLSNIMYISHYNDGKAERKTYRIE